MVQRQQRAERAGERMHHDNRTADAEPFRYLRFRDPPYSDEDLRAAAAGIRDPAYVYFRHEDEPTAPAFAERLKSFL